MLVRMLNSVLFPLPFGPAMPRISLAPREKLMSSTARKPPNDFVRCLGDQDHPRLLKRKG